MKNSQETSGYNTGHGYGYADSVSTGCSCFRWFFSGWDGGEVDGHHFLLQERGLGPQKETWAALEKIKYFTAKIGVKFKNKPTDQFHYSPETYALNFASENEQDENGDLLHSFSSRFASRPLITDQQRRMSAL